MLGTYFDYKASNVTFHKMKIQAQLGMTTKEEVIEEMRKQLVIAMKYGKLLVIDVGALTPDFVNEWTSDDTTFNSHIVFDFEKIRDRDTHMKMVRKEENTDIFGD